MEGCKRAFLRGRLLSVPSVGTIVQQSTFDFAQTSTYVLEGHP
jgi:hypothetical protein